MSKFWKWIGSRAARPGIGTLLLALLLTLGACSEMPAVEVPAAAESEAETAPPEAEGDEDTAAEPETDRNGGGKDVDPVAEHMTGEQETELAAAADAERAAAVVEDWSQHFVAEGQYVYLGNPEAPVTILDVSDFL